MIPGMERRVRAAEGVLDAAAPARSADDGRLAEALERVPQRLLARMLAVGDMDEAEGAAALLADPELMLAIEGMQDLG